MNKKGKFDEMLKIILWGVLFIVLITGVVFLIKKLTNLT